MRTLIAVLIGIGYLSVFIGALAAINTLFDFNLAFKGSPLPKDYFSSLTIAIFGLIIGGIGKLLEQRDKRNIQKMVANSKSKED